MGNGGGGGTKRTGGVQPRGRPAEKWTWGLRRISGLVRTFTSCGMGKNAPAELSVKGECTSLSQKGAIGIKYGTKRKTLHERKGCDACRGTLVLKLGCTVESPRESKKTLKWSGLWWW